MTTPHLNVLDGRQPNARPSATPAGDPAHLQVSGPVQVHVHIGGPPAPGTPPPRSLRSVVWPVLLGAVLLGGGYAAGRRGATAPVEPAGASVPENGTLPPPPLLNQAAPAIPPALRRPLSQPPTITPPPGAAPSARNPFGLSE